MTQPTQRCLLCGNFVTVSPSMRGFPPDSARKTLEAMCAGQGCPCQPQYRAGVDVGGPVTGQ